jgi:hypothetical protein
VLGEGERGGAGAGEEGTPCARAQLLLQARVSVAQCVWILPMQPWW